MGNDLQALAVQDGGISKDVVGHWHAARLLPVAVPDEVVGRVVVHAPVVVPVVGNLHFDHLVVGARLREQLTLAEDPHSAFAPGTGLFIETIRKKSATLIAHTLLSYDWLHSC